MSDFPYIDQGTHVTEDDGTPTLEYHIIWQKLIKALEALEERVAALEP